MADERIVLFGYEPNPPEGPALSRRRMPRWPAARVRGRPREAAREALDLPEGPAGGKFVVHFDVDVVDFVDLSMADVPQHNSGLTFGEAMACLSAFAASPLFGGLVVTEFNPDHADEEGEVAAALAAGLASALAGHAAS
jgi:arginase